MSREKVLAYALKKYNTVPEYLWLKTPDAFVLRKSDSKKWYGLVMNVRKNVFYPDSEGCTDILNVKCSPLVRDCLINEGKAFPAYHMNKKLWISVILEKVSEQELYAVIDDSYKNIKEK